MSDLYIFGYGSSGPSTIDISSATVTLGPSLTYNGTEQTQTVFVEVDGATLTENTDYTITDNTATNAGSYTLSILGTGAYGGTKTTSWSIAKAQGSISASPTSLSIIGANNTATSTITVVGDGAVNVSSSASSVATASISGNTVTVTSAGSGSATITVTLAASTNYTGDTATISVSVVTVSPTLSDNTPEQIQAAAQAGMAASLWSVGARTAAISFQNVTVGALSFNGLSACAFILGFDHNSSKEGTGIHFQMGMTASGTKIAFCDSKYGTKGTGVEFQMNNGYTNSGGWSSSYMRSTICPAFLTALPASWQNAIATTTKYTDNTGGGSDISSYVSATLDKIWLLSEFEVQGARTYANSAEKNNQAQYDYYKNGNNKAFYKFDNTSSGCFWWTRSPRSDKTYMFCLVLNNGGANYDPAYNSFGFAPGFKIA